MNRKKSQAAAEDIEAVVTSFNQGAMILEAVLSLQEQTVPPARICIVDDGSTDETSLRLLKELEDRGGNGCAADRTVPVRTEAYRQREIPESGRDKVSYGPGA